MTIGILGGGQLGRMLVLAGAPLGLRFRVFDPSSEAVAGHLAPLRSGDISDTVALREWAQGLDALTYEWENVPLATVEALAEEIAVFPPALALETAQDRLTEKSFLRSVGVPTPDFWPVSSREQLDAATKDAGFPCVLKTRRGGYDGKGQMVLRSPAGVAEAWRELGDFPLILEAFVPFAREVSILSVRGRNGDTRFWPLVENHHSGGILRLSLAPAPDSTALQSQAETLARAVLENLDYVGVLALELFQIGEKLVANEIAPRVHNSGHWTIEGSHTSQFENHIRAVAGLPLGETAMRTKRAAMVNLVGELPPLREILRVEGAHPHFYGKTVLPNRKVGHISVVAADDAELEARIKRVRNLLTADERR